MRDNTALQAPRRGQYQAKRAAGCANTTAGTTNTKSKTNNTNTQLRLVRQRFPGADLRAELRSEQALQLLHEGSDVERRLFVALEQRPEAAHARQAHRHRGREVVNAREPPLLVRTALGPADA
eukprot:2312614-Rhodomonas_salina.5